MKKEKKLFKKSKGFTLIEMLVVVLIIGILAGIALPQYQRSVWKARFAEVYTVTNALEKAIESYMLSHEGSMPIGGWIDISQELDIDVFSNFTETAIGDHTYYCSKYVCYAAECQKGNACLWRADLYMDINSLDTITAMMLGVRRSAWERSCWYEGETAKIGKPLCESTNWDDIAEGF